MPQDGHGVSREITSSHTVYDGPIFKVVSDQVVLPTGEAGQRDVVHHPGAVGVVAVHDGRVLLVRQYRHSVRRDLLEIPAGRLDRKDELPEQCAMRELVEETGYEAASLTSLGTFLASPGFTDEVYHLYLAEDLRPTGRQPEIDGGEPLVLEQLDLADAESAVIDGRILDAKSVIGILVAARRISSPDG